MQVIFLKRATNYRALLRKMTCEDKASYGKLQLGDYLNARARTKIGKFRRDYAAKNIAFAPAILSVSGKIHPEFLRLLWVLADMQMVKYFNLVGDEEDIGNERFKWSHT